MKSVAEVVRKGKKQKVLRDVAYVRAEAFGQLERLSRVELILDGPRLPASSGTACASQSHRL